MTAEKQYEYRESYSRYGMDMKPQRTKKAKKAAKPIVEISAKDKLRIIGVMLCIGIMCAGLIVSAAYSASLKFEINSIIMENSDLQGEIENLNVKLKENTNIAAIEEKALNELGMMYATSEQIIYIDAPQQVNSDFAAILKEQAYN